MKKRFSILGLTVLAMFTAVGCAGGDEGDEQGPVAGADEDLIRQTGATSHWTYGGMLPELDHPKITVSLKGHTAHVEGLLPRNFDGKLPFYVKDEKEGNRTRIHVVYPIATVDPNASVDGQPARNPEPFNYKICGGDNFHPTNSIGSFGGFPFIQYVCNHTDKDGRVRDGIAFHGPITTRSLEGGTYWSLTRGPVSHACNRMLGEHVLEMAKITGFLRGERGIPVRVIKGFDEWNGKKIDVAYPSTGWSRPDDAVVFPIWQAVRVVGNGKLEIDFPKWACETSRCASMPAHGRNPLTGK